MYVVASGAPRVEATEFTVSESHLTPPPRVRAAEGVAHPLAAEFGRRVAVKAKSVVRRKAGEALHRVGDWAQKLVNGVHDKADEIESPPPPAAPLHPPLAPEAGVFVPVNVRADVALPPRGT